MENKSARNFFLINLGSAFKFISQHLIVSLWLMLLFSVIEILNVWFSKGISDNFFLIVLISGIKNVMFWLSNIWMVYLIFVPLLMIIPRISKVIIKLLIILFFLLHLVLINYYNTALVPLGADVYGYSSKEIKDTLSASGNINLISVLVIILITSLLSFIFFKWIKKLNFSRYTSIVVPILSFILIFSNVYSIKNGLELESEFSNDLALNKSSYFYEASFGHFFKFSNAGELEVDYRNISKSNFTYVDEDKYPFLHEENTTDVLSPYFNTDSVKPNIVIIIVEGLGRSFSNDNAYLGSFTPFLDSLSKKSLYWENFLSQGGRTFAVIPSVLGSLPFAKNGFLAMDKNMPNHLSLINLLRYNGYQSAFYYGGDAEFDNMAQYFKMNHIDELMDDMSFPSNYRKLPPLNNFSWGYDDSELYRHYLSTQPIISKPKINILLTVSSHNSFKINDEEKYHQLFEKRMDFLGFDNEKKNTYRNYRDQYTSIVYTDDALKSFFKNYQNREDFKNTIFIITGDHRLPEIPMSTKIDRYHVPLIIYSPLLKKSEKFKSISTHFDIAPSILAYLKNSYGIKTPKLSTWIGEGLKTDKSFGNNNSVPIMQNKTDLVDFISGNYHVNQGNLYLIQPDMGEEKVNNKPAIKTKLMGQFSLFKYKNNQIIQGSHLLPDSIINEYTKPLK